MNNEMGNKVEWKGGPVWFTVVLLLCIGIGLLLFGCGALETTFGTHRELGTNRLGLNPKITVKGVPTGLSGPLISLNQTVAVYSSDQRQAGASIEPDAAVSTGTGNVTKDTAKTPNWTPSN